MPGPQELVIILIIVLVLFGAKKLPELARGLGQGIREFKKATNEPEDKNSGERLEQPKSQTENH